METNQRQNKSVSNPHTIVVGMSVLVTHWYRSRALEYRVTRLDNDYFYTTGGFKFNLQTLIQDNGGYAPLYTLYLSQEDYKQKMIEEELRNELKTLIKSNYFDKSSIDIVKKVLNLIKNP
jgi:hypothetical protein